jgi:hypothetical protein
MPSDRTHPTRAPASGPGPRAGLLLSAALIALALPAAAAEAQLCLAPCPPVGLVEPEACGQSLNGGCNATPPIFTDAGVNELRCGAAWAAGGQRDTDWYRVFPPEGGTLTSTIVAELPCVTLIVGGIANCQPMIISEVGFSSACASGPPASAVVSGGAAYVIFVAPGNPDGTGIFNGFPCGGGANLYQVQIALGTGGCGDPGSGDCCAGASGPGCDDTACCQTICAMDPSCCNVQWDEQCAAQAACVCVVCGIGGCDLGCADNEGEPCGQSANGGCSSTPPAFNDIACGDTVCGTVWAHEGVRDTDWHRVTVGPGTITATILARFCGVAIVVDGLDTCVPVAIGAIGASASCQTLTAASAETAGGTFAIFVSTALPDATPIYGGVPCASGLNGYRLTVECPAPDPCVGGQGSCWIPTGTPGCNFAPCCTLVCAGHPECCAIAWDLACAQAAALLCNPCALSGNECCAPSPDPGCSDAPCCAAVCSVDPACCAVAWDGNCAALAGASGACGLCLPCDVACVGVAEGEPCGADSNAGCNSTPPAFGSIACGASTCGQAWAQDGSRDTDWYLVSLTSATSLTATLVAQFPGTVLIVDGLAACNPEVAGAAGGSAECQVEAVAAAELAPGSYAVFVAPDGFEGVPCAVDGGQVGPRYRLSLDCEVSSLVPCCLGEQGCVNVDAETCAAACGTTQPGPCDGHHCAADLCRPDVDGDGWVGATDLVAVLLAWGCSGPAGSCPGEVDGDCAVGVGDLVEVVVEWGACP